MVTLSTNSLTGTGRNRAWPSTESWSCVTARISNPVNSPPALSTCVLAQSAVSHTKRRTGGLLSADLAAGIRRVGGVKKLGMRLGNWLTPEQGHALWQAPDCQRLKGKRDRALLALLLASGLRRHEAVALRLDHLQQREEHRAIVHLVGKGGHVRTAPVPDWVRTELDDWLAAAAIDRGKRFRRATK
jgi:integrase